MTYNINTNYYGTDGYTVTNGVDDVVDIDHNVLVTDIRNFGQQFSAYGYGNGEDGKFLIGSITNPTASNVAVATDTGLAGEITGTVYYKYCSYNFSGVTTVVNASVAITVTAKKVQVVIPAQASLTNITGFKLYRSYDDITYFHVADIPVALPTSATTIIDNNPITSGTAPSGSNTTSNTATVNGIYRVSSLTLTSGQTVNLDVNNVLGNKMGLIILCSGIVDIQSGATINGTGVGGSHMTTNATNSSFTTAIGGTYPNTTARTSPIGSLHGTEVFGTEMVFGNLDFTWIGAQGGSTDGYSTSYQAGATIIIVAKTQINIQGSIISSGAVAAGSGNAGGLIALISQLINRSGGTLTANGSNAVTGGGGGGGIIAFAYNFLKGTSTNTVNAGTGVAGGQSGGAFGGYGGSPTETGGVGMIISKPLNKAILPRF